jgi:hypothetical protein
MGILILPTYPRNRRIEIIGKIGYAGKRFHPSGPARCNLQTGLVY